MRSIALLCSVVTCLWGGLEAVAETAATSGARIEESLARLGTIEFSSTGRDRLNLRFTAAKPIAVTIPAGTIAQAADGAKLVTLRATTVGGASGETVTMEIPVASLANTPPGELRPFHLLDEREERLQSFLTYAADHDDLPRTTAQLVVLALVESLSFADWLRFRSSKDPAVSAQAITEAIDAMGILRTLFPQREFAFASDTQLKVRALRNPSTRAKASQLYGLSLPGDPSPAAGTAPDLGQLLHSKAGDNCPVCRMRQQTERSKGDL